MQYEFSIKTAEKFIGTVLIDIIVTGGQSHVTEI